MPSTIRIAATIHSTEAEGPGRRWALWVQGCPLRCPGCCNPELLPTVSRSGDDRVVTVDALVDEIRSTPDIEGISLLGGEPFGQADGLAELAERVRHRLTVMVYSGFTLAELRARPDSGARRLLAATDLLVDGRYERDQPETRRRWIGSRNQICHFLTERYAPDDRRFTQPNTVELRLSRGLVTLNGWPTAARLP